MHPKLRHFMQNKSLSKALDFINSHGLDAGN